MSDDNGCPPPPAEEMPRYLAGCCPCHLSVEYVMDGPEGKGMASFDRYRPWPGTPHKGQRIIQGESPWTIDAPLRIHEICIDLDDEVPVFERKKRRRTMAKRKKKPPRCSAPMDLRNHVCNAALQFIGGEFTRHPDGLWPRFLSFAKEHHGLELTEEEVDAVMEQIAQDCLTK